MTPVPKWAVPTFFVGVVLCLLGVGMMGFDNGVGGVVFGAIGAALAAYQAGLLVERQKHQK
jgi:hypothetical protein